MYECTKYLKNSFVKNLITNIFLTKNVNHNTYSIIEADNYFM
jgi:hypothetical protein